MSETELANAEFWANLWHAVEYWAFFGVVVTLAVEFAATKFAKPHIARIEAAQKQSLEDRKKENLQLQTKLEQEQIRRAQLVQSVLWRNGRLWLGDWYGKKYDEQVELALKLDPDNPKMPHIPTIDVSIVCVKQREPMWVAHSMAGSLIVSNFRLTGLTFTEVEQIPEGIVVERMVGPKDDGDFRYEAASAIVAALKENFVLAREHPQKLPRNTLRITIGPSDRLTGPMTWNTFDKDGNELPPNELPPPIRIKNEKGEWVDVEFPAPADKGSANAASNIK